MHKYNQWFIVKFTTMSYNIDEVKLMTTGERLYNERKIQKFKLEQIAEIIDISYQAYRKFEKDICSPSNETLKKLAIMYNVSTDYILGLTDDKRKYW